MWIVGFLFVERMKFWMSRGHSSVMFESLAHILLVVLSSSSLLVNLLLLLLLLFIELCKEQHEALSKSKRISNPGCYPTGFIGLTRPLVDAGLIPEGTPLTVNAISGYSGGGKELMAIFEQGKAEPWGAYGFSLVSYYLYKESMVSLFMFVVMTTNGISTSSYTH
jgi:hypothetical protein